MEFIVKTLDRVASELEARGLKDEAYTLDVIANTVEAWDMQEKDPMIVKIKPGHSVKADSVVLVNQLKSDIGQALSLASAGAQALLHGEAVKDADKYNDDLKKEIKKVGGDVKAWGQLITVKGWGAGKTYDLCGTNQPT